MSEHRNSVAVHWFGVFVLQTPEAVQQAKAMLAFKEECFQVPGEVVREWSLRYSCGISTHFITIECYIFSSLLCNICCLYFHVLLVQLKSSVTDAQPSMTLYSSRVLLRSRRIEATHFPGWRWADRDLPIHIRRVLIPFHTAGLSFSSLAFHTANCRS